MSQNEDATKIVPLRPGTKSELTTQAKEPHEGVIRMLEQALQEARAGSIVGLTMAHHGPDFRATYSLVGFIGGYSMQGAVQCALHELIDLNRGVAELEEEDG
jgi:hypothetical protein